MMASAGRPTEPVSEPCRRPESRRRRIARKMPWMTTVTIHAILRPEEDLVQTLAGICRGLADALDEPLETIDARFVSSEGAVAGDRPQARFEQRPYFEIVGHEHPPGSIEAALRAVAAAVAVGVGVWPDHVSGRFVVVSAGTMIAGGEIVGSAEPGTTTASTVR